LSENVTGKILNAGNPLYDVFIEKSKMYPLTDITTKLNLTKNNFTLFTCHRAENVDNEKILNNIISGIGSANIGEIVFPIHPRTKDNLIKFGLFSKLKNSKHIIIIDPVGYEEMLDLIIGSRFIITDSGGLLLEANFARKHCLTIRKSTEWVETVRAGVNILSNPEINSISKDLNKITINEEEIKKKFKKKNCKNIFGNGRSSASIVKSIIEFSQNHAL